MDTTESAQLLELLYLIPVGVVRCNEAGTIELINPVATGLLTQISDDMRVENLFDCLAAAIPELQELAKSRDCGLLLTQRFPVSENGWCEAAVSRVAGNVIVVILQDVTDRVELDRKLLDQLERDSLTNLLNRRGFRARFEQLGDARRARDSVSLMLVDVDHFKRINDSFGHDVGDQVLQGVASVLSSTIRDDDALCRWGGEEFAVLCPQTPLGGAEVTAGRILTATREMAIEIPSTPVSATVSIGVAQRQSGETLRSLVRRADEALYRAKRSGRDRVCVAK